MTKQVDCDVVVVGAGPVGLTTALLLRRFGHDVRVLERHPERYPQPRAVGIFHQGVRAYAALGLWDDLFEAGALTDIQGMVSNMVTYVDGEGQRLAQHPINNGTSKSGTAQSYAMHQPTLEEVLERACRDRGVKVHRSFQVKSVVDDGANVEVHGAESSTNTTTIVRAWFVVGCDGANSTVRASANVKFSVHEPASSRWLVVDVIPIGSSTTYQWKDGYYGKQYLDPCRPRTSVPSPPTRRRWEFMVMPEESTDLATSDSFIWKLLADFDCTPETAVIERKTVYSIGGGWAETFSKGRIALAGDAAHLAPQFLGQGLNSGLRDAKSLAWRLDFALRNPDRNWQIMLADYSTEQLGTTKQFVAAAKTVEKILTITNPEKAKFRDAQIKQGRLHIPDLERVGDPGMHLREGSKAYNKSGCEPGTLFIQDKLFRNGKTGFFDEVVGEGWSLISKDASPAMQDALSPEIRQKFTDLFGAMQLVHLSDDSNSGWKDLSGRYTNWFQESEVQAVLVRPDYYIYGTAKTWDEIEGLVKGVVEHVSF